MTKIQRYKDPVERAQFSNSLVDQYVSEITTEEETAKLISCRKGCSACCHTQVSVNSDEAQLLVTRLLEDGVKIDMERLEKQAKVMNDNVDWLKLAYQDRGCIFLDDKGACRVYSDRPSVCRTNNVVSNPSLCDTSSGAYQKIRLLKTSKADLVTIAAYNASSEGGVMAYMLVKTFNSLANQKLSKSMKKNFKKYGFKRLKELFNDSMM